MITICCLSSILLVFSIGSLLRVRGFVVVILNCKIVVENSFAAAFKTAVTDKRSTLKLSRILMKSKKVSMMTLSS